MGLDMWFHAYPRGKRWDEVDSNGDDYGREICYFRKHSDLNGLLQYLWLKDNPGKSGEDFNCEHMTIDKKVLRYIERVAYLKEDKREHYVGFFWGSSDEDQWKETRLTLIPRIKEELRNGNTVIYHPWW